MYILLLFFLVDGLTAQTSQYVNCAPGNLNVILTAPHGGSETPTTIRDRDAGCYTNNECVWDHDCGRKDTNNCAATTVKDSFTYELILLVADNLEQLTGLRPTTSINLLHRIKLDANREINEATFGEPESVQAWEAYHACANTSKADIESSNGGQGTGLYVDLHGHGHAMVWAELGYLYTATELNNDNIPPEESSIYYLSTRSNLPFEDVLRGNASFGKLLEDRGFAAVPSPTYPGPGVNPYFSGGYNTEIHGSRDGGRIDGIQIESAYENRQLPTRNAYALAIAESIVEYMSLHGFQLSR